MGMFDTVHLRCPHCQERVSFQTKEGRCLLIDYELREMPGAIAESLARHPQSCEKCGETIFFKAQVVVSIAAFAEDPTFESSEQENDSSYDPDEDN